MLKVQLRIHGDPDKLQFASKKELIAYLKELLNEAPLKERKEVDHLPLVEFYNDQGSVTFRDFTELPETDIISEGAIFVKINGKSSK